MSITVELPPEFQEQVELPQNAEKMAFLGATVTLREDGSSLIEFPERAEVHRVTDPWQVQVILRHPQFDDGLHYHLHYPSMDGHWSFNPEHVKEES